MMLGFYLYVAGDEKWNEPFDMFRDGENTFTWSHTTIADHLSLQWSKTAEGCQ